MSKKILVVDDEPDVITYLEMVLNQAGFAVITASNVKAGINLMRREKPGLVILDLLMPKNTGTDFFRRMGEEEEIADTPVIVVSALAGRGLVGNNLAVNKAVAVFDKPVDPEELVAAVNLVLGT